MSYQRPRTGNSVTDYHAAVQDFNVLSPRVLAAETALEFDVWLDKLARIDPRFAAFYLNGRKNEIRPEFLRRGAARLGPLWNLLNGPQ